MIFVGQWCVIRGRCVGEFYRVVQVVRVRGLYIVFVQDDVTSRVLTDSVEFSGTEKDCLSVCGKLNAALYRKNHMVTEAVIQFDGEREIILREARGL